jgi:non-heme chloroperoxidase
MSLRHVLPRLRTLLALGALLLASTATPAQTRAWTVTAPDGVTLAVQEAGNPDGPAVILIHGLLGSHLNWDAQLNSAPLRRYRLITYDLRGHGLSGKPAGLDAYHDGRRWADDLAAIIQASHARRPVLVGWSLGGVVISNYLAAYGDAAIAGAAYVDGVIELKPDQIVAHQQMYRDMISPDLKTHLDGERAFLERCFHTPPDPATFTRLLANAAMASWDMQRAVPSMTVDASGGLSRAEVPVWLLYGAQDALVNPAVAIARAKALNPRIRSTLYENVGHAPFIEAPARFNRDLAGFVDAANAAR